MSVFLFFAVFWACVRAAAAKKGTTFYLRRQPFTCFFLPVVQTCLLFIHTRFYMHPRSHAHAQTLTCTTALLRAPLLLRSRTTENALHVCITRHVSDTPFRILYCTYSSDPYLGYHAPRTTPHLSLSLARTTNPLFLHTPSLSSLLPFASTPPADIADIHA